MSLEEGRTATSQNAPSQRFRQGRLGFLNSAPDACAGDLPRARTSITLSDVTFWRWLSLLALLLLVAGPLQASAYKQSPYRQGVACHQGGDGPNALSAAAQDATPTLCVADAESGAEEESEQAAVVRPWGVWFGDLSDYQTIARPATVDSNSSRPRLQARQRAPPLVFG